MFSHAESLRTRKVSSTRILFHGCRACPVHTIKRSDPRGRIGRSHAHVSENLRDEGAYRNAKVELDVKPDLKP